jgi:hypothetical protein
MVGDPIQSCENKWCFAPEYSLMNKFSGKCVAPWVVSIGGKADEMRGEAASAGLSSTI